jgi:hypothetical protein
MARSSVALALSFLFVGEMLLAACVDPPTDDDASSRAPDAPSDARPVRDGARGSPFGIVPQTTSLVIRAGTTLALPVRIERGDGYRDTIRLETFGLPSGLHASPLDVPAERTLVVLEIVAAQRAHTDGDVPFALQASAGGWRRTVRATVRVAP